MVAPHRTLAAAVALGIALGAAGCQTGGRPRPHDPLRDLADPDPGLRSRTIARTPVRGDRALVAECIERLDDLDPTVRLQASAALKEATGQASSYRPFDPPAARRPYLLAWRAWWRGEIPRPDPALLGDAQAEADLAPTDDPADAVPAEPLGPGPAATRPPPDAAGEPEAEGAGDDGGVPGPQHADAEGGSPR